jgi:hypothetical protein
MTSQCGDEVLLRVAPDMFWFAPIPFVHHQADPQSLDAWHGAMIAEARRAYTPAVLDVPDTRHAHDLGRPPDRVNAVWSESQPTAVGIWHRVPTNNFLHLGEPGAERLRALIEEKFLVALHTFQLAETSSRARITESWIQFYRAGDNKVLHNHERYGPPYPRRPWAGAYYLDDGDPHPDMPYAGVLSFQVRGLNYFFRPRPGLLLMWPADVLHQVHPFYGSRERVVVNFNISDGGLGASRDDHADRTSGGE